MPATVATVHALFVTRLRFRPHILLSRGTNITYRPAAAYLKNMHRKPFLFSKLVTSNLAYVVRPPQSAGSVYTRADPQFACALSTTPGPRTSATQQRCIALIHEQPVVLHKKTAKTLRCRVLAITKTTPLPRATAQKHRDANKTIPQKTFTNPMHPRTPVISRLKHHCYARCHATCKPIPLVMHRNIAHGTTQ